MSKGRKLRVFYLIERFVEDNDAAIEKAEDEIAAEVLGDANEDNVQSQCSSEYVRPTKKRRSRTTG